MFPIKTVQDYMYPQKLRGDLAEQAQRARLYGEQAQWYGPKSQADINLINQGQIPHYQALNELIRQGQIPHYLAQSRLIDQGQIPHYLAQSRLIDQGQIPHYLAQSRLIDQGQIPNLREQAIEQSFKNKYTGNQWNQWKRLQDEIDAMNGEGQTEQPSQNNSNYPTNTPSLDSEDNRRIEDNLKKSYIGLKGQIDPSKFGLLGAAFNAKQGQPNFATQQQNNPYPFTPVPQRINEVMNQFNQPEEIQQVGQGNQQRLGEAQQQLGAASQLAAQKSFNKEQRIAELRSQQQAIFGNLGKIGKAGAETPEEKRQGQISVAQEKENIKEAAKDAEKAELASEASQVAEGALNKMLESSKKMTMLQSGGLFGHAPGFADARQEFDQESAMLQKSVMDSMKGQGQMSQAKMRFIESLKPNSKMNEKVRESTALTLLAAAKRSGERITFNASATDAGFDPKQTKVLWKLYNDERPEYDSKNKRPIDDNLNTFSDYINKDALDAAIHGKPYSPKKQGEESNMVMIQLPTGQKGNISKEKLDEALKRGARIIQ